MVIIGAKGTAREILTEMTWVGVDTDNLFFFDNVNKDTPDKLFDKFPVIKSWEELAGHFKDNSADFILGLGGSKARFLLANQIVKLGGVLNSYISGKALIGDFGNEIGQGVCILANAMITCDVKIGKGSFISKGSLVSHDVEIGEYCEVSPHVKVLGRAVIGSFSELGSGSIILPDIELGQNCIVGAGAVVTKHFPENSVVAGVPARLIKMNESANHD